MTKKTVLIINTGGTISSVATPHGYVPVQGHVDNVLKNMPMLSHPDLPNYVVEEFEPLIDSSNMDIEHWNRLAAMIHDAYDSYDGFIIFHGTDTLAYTASALSFMLEHLNKPVIFTGSQIPLTVVRSDAIDNIQTSLWLAAHSSVHEVCIYFNQKLLRGNRARKLHNQDFHAFGSPNFPELANIGIEITLHAHRLLPASNQELHVQLLRSQRITNVRLFPGFDIQLFEHLLQQPLQALILETYGAGNANNNNPLFLELLHHAIEQGTIIINLSQCVYGKTRMDYYATGHGLKQRGLISGYDMTPECTHSKLLYLFSKYNDVERIKQCMQTNLRGELTP